MRSKAKRGVRRAPAASARLAFQAGKPRAMGHEEHYSEPVSPSRSGPRARSCACPPDFQADLLVRSIDEYEPSK